MNPEKEARKAKRIAVLRKYLPEGFELFVLQLLEKYPVNFKIVPPRATKLGDFRVDKLKNLLQITVNGNLNAYSFLITTVHEFAHLITYKKYGFKAKPHGEEWKREYSVLVSEMLHYHSIPKDIETALINSLVNVKASSCSDLGLMRVLKAYDTDKLSGKNIESLTKNTIFVYQKRKFRLLEKRRTRYLCEELITQRKYLFHALTEIDMYE